jgi:hypothetical protein
VDTPATAFFNRATSAAVKPRDACLALHQLHLDRSDFEA